MKSLTYALIDPLSTKVLKTPYLELVGVFYIGSGLPDRPFSHMHRALWNVADYNQNQQDYENLIPVQKYIANMISEDRWYEVVILDWSDSREESYSYEKYLISCDTDKILTNMRSGYSNLGPYLAISPEGNLSRIDKGKLPEFCSSNDLSYRGILSSAEYYINHMEPHKNPSNSWTIIPIDTNLDNLELNDLASKIFEDVGYTLEYFISVEPFMAWNDADSQAKAGKSRSEYYKRIGGMTEESRKKLSESKRKISLALYGFESEESLKSFINKKHHEEFISSTQIANEIGSSQCYILTYLDNPMSRAELTARRYGFSSNDEAIKVIRDLQAENPSATAYNIAGKLGISRVFVGPRMLNLNV